MVANYVDKTNCLCFTVQCGCLYGVCYPCFKPCHCGDGCELDLCVCCRSFFNCFQCCDGPLSWTFTCGVCGGKYEYVAMPGEEQEAKSAAVRSEHAPSCQGPPLSDWTWTCQACGAQEQFKARKGDDEKRKSAAVSAGHKLRCIVATQGKPQTTAPAPIAITINPLLSNAALTPAAAASPPPAASGIRWVCDGCNATIPPGAVKYDAMRPELQKDLYCLCQSCFASGLLTENGPFKKVIAPAR